MKNIRSYKTLADALNSEYNSTELKELAALICPKVPNKKAERVEAIVTVFFKDPKAIFAKLPTIAQHAVAETIHTWDGLFQARMFEAKYEASPWTAQQDRYGGGREKDLLSLFLLTGCTIPVDMLAQLQTFVPRPPRDKIAYAEKSPCPDCLVRKTARSGLANAVRLLHLAETKELRVSAKTGRASAATTKKIGELLHDGDWYDDEEIGPIQAFAWPLLLQAGGLARVNGASLELTPAGTKALKNDAATGIKNAWQKWEKTTLIDEFSRVTAIKGQKSGSGRTMSSPVKRRPAINLLLKNLEPGKWIEVDELARIAQSREEYAFPMVNLDWKLYLFDQQYGNLDYYPTWPLLQFRYLLVYLFEYCATLGLIDVAYKDPRGARDDYKSCWGGWDLEFLSHCDGLRAIRVNELGAFVFGHSETFEPARHAGDLFAFEGRDIVFVGQGEVPPGQTIFLERIAERRDVTRWRLSASTLLTALNRGTSLSEIRDYLIAHSTNEPSREAEQLFSEVEQRAGAFVEIGKASLLQCSPEMLQQVLASKKISRLCLPAGDRHLVILPGKEKQFSDALEALGFSVGIDR